TTTTVPEGSASAASSCWQLTWRNPSSGFQGPPQRSGRSGHWDPSCQPEGRTSGGATVATSSVARLGASATGGAGAVRCRTAHQDGAGGVGVRRRQLLAVDVAESLFGLPGAAAAFGQIGPLGSQLPAVGAHIGRGDRGDLVGREARGIGDGRRGRGAVQDGPP